MAYSSHYTHLVWSTQERRRLISPEIEGPLWAYMGGIARQHETKALIVGGIEDHVHVLLSFPASVSVSTIVQKIKAGSSKWMKEHGHKQFVWQEGFGSFTVGISQIEETIEYVRHQREHHRRFDFRTEYIHFLKKHGIEYDKRYVLG